MKLLFSLSIILLSFGASTDEISATPAFDQNTSAEYYPGKGRKKGGRREMRRNKKRKRKCHQFGRKSYAG